jgi:hypothetical protein
MRQVMAAAQLTNGVHGKRRQAEIKHSSL